MSLYIGASFPAAWEHVLLPWFQAAGSAVSAREERAAVVTPSRSHADFLRRKLLAQRTSLMGVEFLTPPQLRELLLLGSPRKLPLREHLRLLLAIEAEDVASALVTNKGDNRLLEVQVAKSVARDPDNFLRAIDQLRAAGCELQEIEPPILAEIATRFEQRVHDCGFTFIHEADRGLIDSADKSPPQFSHLLVNGFDGAHWPLWPLLRTSIRRSRQATVLLNDPRDEARDTDETWIGTWEEHFGAVTPVPPLGSDPHRFAELTQALDSPIAVVSRKNKPLPGVHFVIGRNTSEQARAIATLAVSFLNSPPCEEVAILLPGPGGLARLVAQALDALGIPHNDSIAHSMRGALDDEEWRAWVELQNRPQLAPFLRFLSHSPTAVAFFSELPLREIEKKLRHACGDILINDIAVLAEYCSRRSDETCSVIARGLQAVHLLAERATLNEFLKTTTAIFRELQWRERTAELKRLSDDWSAALTGTFSREHFLRWLTEIFAESALCREANGDHPYARVQLFRYDHAEYQSWSHLILAGLNEGIWPKRDDESPFLPDEQIAALNARMRTLNKRATHEGRFGAGQTTVREGTTLCLGTRQQREIVLRQLFNAIESSTVEIGVTGQLYTSTPREQALNPSEFFARLYFNACGVTLSQAEIERIHAQTRDWLARTDLFQPANSDNADLAQTAAAYLERRRPAAKFSEYEFAFRENFPPARQTSLSATDAARLFTTPALVWMKIFLGVETDALDTTSWSLVTGQWVHRWLAVVGHEPRENRFVARPSAEEILRRVTNTADNFRGEIMSILSARSRPLPDWWVSGWRNARYLAQRFAKEVGHVTDWPQLATEWHLESPQVIRLDDLHELRVRGRIDLLLARGDRSDSNEFWIVDYKTGMATPLRSQRSALRKQLTAGNGVQICVYALALRALGWREIGASLLTRENELSGWQIRVSDIAAHDEIWNEVSRMQHTGIFGMLGELRSEFTFTGDYPLATLAIDKDLLREKWQRTHPAFATGESYE